MSAIIIGKWLFPLTEELATAMMREGKTLVSWRRIPGVKIWGNRAELDAQAFRDRTGFA